MTQPPLRHPLFRISLRWLFCLVLALPMAQLAAYWHATAHTSAHSQAPLQAQSQALGPTQPDASAAGSHEAPGSVQADHCGLCLASAAIGAGALPSTPPDLQRAAVLQAPPRAPVGNVWQQRPLAAYRSRAPPISVL